MESHGTPHEMVLIVYGVSSYDIQCLRFHKEQLNQDKSNI